MAKYRAIFFLGFALAAAVAAMGYRIARTPAAPIESDRYTWTRLAWADRDEHLFDQVTDQRLMPLPNDRKQVATG